MRKFSWRPILAWTLAAFFLVGAIGNIFVSESIAEDYLRWGYPDWFHFVTGALELTTAVLLAVAATRLWGAALGCVAMFAAAATVIVHGEYAHAIPPVVVLALSAVVGWTAWRLRSSTSA
ncbi:MULTISPECIES: DoxX family protein [unclassified Pseudomonas]|uniref:DoxX family protein n=1 Tax=unclassified Pseudomonas TaxID=196821 RepID=UPI000517EC2B|nr:MULTISPECIES: DoxX family protein [unclassified Pseudomonas]